MNRYKKVAFVFISDFRSVLQRDKCVIVSRHDHFDIFELFFYLRSQFLCDSKIYVFFLNIVADCSGIMSAMTRINDYCEYILLFGRIV